MADLAAPLWSLFNLKGELKINMADIDIPIVAFLTGVLNGMLIMILVAYKARKECEAYGIRNKSNPETTESPNTPLGWN